MDLGPRIAGYTHDETLSFKYIGGKTRRLIVTPSDLRPGTTASLDLQPWIGRKFALTPCHSNNVAVFLSVSRLFSEGGKNASSKRCWQLREETELNGRKRVFYVFCKPIIRQPY